ncbi:hypothetical protein SESBI_33939 [Sesbania bispinosa]|nr:hypothetical protein SESBI_33939 [Sesbania bispinosa]
MCSWLGRGARVAIVGGGAMDGGEEGSLVAAGAIRRLERLTRTATAETATVRENDLVGGSDWVVYGPIGRCRMEQPKQRPIHQNPQAKTYRRHRSSSSTVAFLVQRDTAGPAMTTPESPKLQLCAQLQMEDSDSCGGTGRCYGAVHGGY